MPVWAILPTSALALVLALGPALALALTLALVLALVLALWLELTPVLVAIPAEPSVGTGGGGGDHCGVVAHPPCVACSTAASSDGGAMSWTVFSCWVLSPTLTVTRRVCNAIMSTKFRNSLMVSSCLPACLAMSLTACSCLVVWTSWFWMLVIKNWSVASCWANWTLRTLIVSACAVTMDLRLWCCTCKS